MMTTGDALHVSLDAEPESIGLVRGAVADLASSCGMEEPTLGDLKTVLSEACSNVVRHAYPGPPGVFEVEASPRGRAGGRRARLRDRDARSPRANQSSMRLGFGLIAMLSSQFEIAGRRGGGTEIRIRLPLPS